MKHKLQFIKPSLLLITMLLSALIGLQAAQTDPGTTNLKHQWTFDDGTANDAVTVNPVNGALTGGATIVNKALKLTTAGQYLSFSGAALALNGYTAISQEIWYASVAGANTGYTMLSYFGNTSGGMGYNYISTSTARGDDVSRTCITNGTYNSEIGANGTEYDDGILHHMVSVIRTDSVMLYIDGALVSKVANTIPLSTIGTSLAYLGKGGYTADPTWIGSISKFSIYNKSLSAAEVKYLYQEGAETSPFITSPTTALSFDDLYKSETINITGLNLTNAITITSPAGVTVNPTTLASNASNAAVTVTYDGTSSVNGNITFSSGNGILNIPVKSYTNTCFSSLYPTVVNLVTNPYISSLSYFAGWGTRSINSNPTYVYCGATSGRVTGTNAGSLDVSLTGKLLTNTNYRVKAKIYAIDGSFQVGIFGWNGTLGDYTKVISTTGSWQDADFTFTTGASLGATQGLFFNNYGLSGTTGYIDNWEMYAIPKVYTSSASLSFITTGTKAVSIRGVSLSQDIIITAPEGFTVSPSTMLASVSGSTLTVTYTGSKNTSGYVNFNSGTVKDSILVTGTTAPTLTKSVAVVAMDELNNTSTFTVTGYNLSTGITFTAPAGITLSPPSLPETASGSTITVSYDGVANSSGYIKITSATAKDSVWVIAARNEECFTQLYPGATNLIVDPTCNSYTTDGWGNKSINSDPAYVYCGARSGKVTDSGSLERNLTGVMQPNTRYRVKAKVYKYSSRKGQDMGNVTYTLGIDSLSFPEPYRLIKIAMDSACALYSKYTPFVENVNVYYSSGVPTAEASYHGGIGFGSDITYMWVGTAIHELDHYFGSGTSDQWHALMVNGVWQGTVANTLMKTINGGTIDGDTQHFWPYGINYKTEITGLGNQAAQLQGLITAVKIAKAMLVDDCGLATNNTPVRVGVSGYDANLGDLTKEVTTTNNWQDIDFTFTSGSTLKATQGVFFNSGTGYIDNWEMYEVPGTNAINAPKLQECKIFLQDNSIVTDFNLQNAGLVKFDVFNTQGMLIYSQSGLFNEGNNHVILNAKLKNGVYVVRIFGNGSISTGKVIL